MMTTARTRGIHFREPRNPRLYRGADHDRGNDIEGTRLRSSKRSHTPTRTRTAFMTVPVVMEMVSGRSGHARIVTPR